MPFYDYYSDTTKEEKEVFHLMSEEPEILDSKGNKMRRKVTGGSGYIMKGGGTRNNNWASRYGGKKKKSSNIMSPAESSSKKAAIDFTDRKDQEASKHDPYHKFRETNFS